jgi:hypothetical protein
MVRMALTVPITTTMTARNGKAPSGQGASQSINPRDKPKKAAFSTAPERIAPDAPLPEP